MLPAIIGAILPGIIETVIKRSIQDPQVPIDSHVPPSIAAREVADQVIEEVRRSPEVQHATNNEPWYQSRVTWGAIISGAAGFAGAFGFAFSPEDVDVIVGAVTAAATIIGSAVTLYGRWKAKKPIGA